MKIVLVLLTVLKNYNCSPSISFTLKGRAGGRRCQARQLAGSAASPSAAAGLVSLSSSLGGSSLKKKKRRLEESSPTKLSAQTQTWRLPPPTTSGESVAKTK